MVYASPTDLLDTKFLLEHEPERAQFDVQLLGANCGTWQYGIWREKRKKKKNPQIWKYN